MKNLLGNYASQQIAMQTASMAAWVSGSFHPWDWNIIDRNRAFGAQEGDRSLSRMFMDGSELTITSTWGFDTQNCEWQTRVIPHISKISVDP
jgi:hypothetical protein